MVLRRATDLSADSMTHSLLAPFLSKRARNQWAEASIMRTRLRRENYAREARANIACLLFLAATVIIGLGIGFHGFHYP